MARICLCLFVAAVAGIVVGCAKPIPMEVYSRTPDRPQAPAFKADRIGIGAESPETGAEFIAHARSRGQCAFVGWARPENISDLDCQVDMVVSLEYSSASKADYCLGRLVANIYKPDHSKLLDRVVLFQEAMYTMKSSNTPELTHDGKNAAEQVKASLFDAFIADLNRRSGAVARR